MPASVHVPHGRAKLCSWKLPGHSKEGPVCQVPQPPRGTQRARAAVGSAWQALPGREGEVGTTVPPQMTPCSLMMGRAGLTQQLVTVRQVQAKAGPQESRTPSPPPVLTVSKGCLESKPPHTCGVRHPWARRVRQGGVIRAPNQIDLRGPGAGQARPVPRGSRIPPQRPSPQAKGRRVCPHPRNGRTQFQEEGAVGKPGGGLPPPSPRQGRGRSFRLPQRAPCCASGARAAHPLLRPSRPTRAPRPRGRWETRRGQAETEAPSPGGPASPGTPQVPTP